MPGMAVLNPKGVGGNRKRSEKGEGGTTYPEQASWIKLKG